MAGTLINTFLLSLVILALYFIIPTVPTAGCTQQTAGEAPVVINHSDTSFVFDVRVRACVFGCLCGCVPLYWVSALIKSAGCQGG